MPEKTLRQAINEAMFQEMERDPDVLQIGEDIVGGKGGGGEEDPWGGVMGVTKGLVGPFGENRMLDTPLSESAFIGAAVGAAASGLRPIAELMFCDFMGVCFDQIYNQAAKFKYMFGGKSRMPLVIRMQYGGGLNAAAQHSQSLYPIFTHIPGLKVVVPSNPYDAKGLLIEAIRDDDPVMYFEHKALYDMKGEVPDEPYTIPFGEAKVVRDGDDLTIVAMGRMMQPALAAAEKLAEEGVEAVVVDLRTTSPMDETTLLEAVEATGRLVIVDEGYPRCGLAADVAALVAERGYRYLRAPIRRVTPPHTPVPFAPPLEELYFPDTKRVLGAAREALAA